MSDPNLGRSVNWQCHCVVFLQKKTDCSILSLLIKVFRWVMSILCHGVSLCWTSILDGCGVQVNFLMLPTTETVNVDLSVKSKLFFRLGQFFGFVPQQVSIDYFPSRTRRSLPKTPLKAVEKYIKITLFTLFKTYFTKQVKSSFQK